MPAKKATKPTITAPRSVKRAQAKEKIFDAAMQLLQDYGYDYITVNNICEMAGISVGNFYHYFENKDELMSNFFVVAWEKYVVTQRKAAPQAAPATPEEHLAAIVAFFESYSEFCAAQGLEFVRHFYLPTNTALSMTITPAAETHFALPSLQHVEAQVRAAQEAGVLAPEADPVQLTDDLCMLEKGCVFEWCVSEARFPLPALTRRILTQHLRSYLA